eukprot:227037-Alexandrium_andersonii.AAC.1
MSTTGEPLCKVRANVRRQSCAERSRRRWRCDTPVLKEAECCGQQAVNAKGRPAPVASPRCAAAWWRWGPPKKGL